MYYAIVMNDGSYISHHGILGQKWGIRRYQNEDGTLTPEGRRRYNKLVSKNLKMFNDERRFYEEYSKSKPEADKKADEAYKAYNDFWTKYSKYLDVDSYDSFEAAGVPNGKKLDQKLNELWEKSEIAERDAMYAAEKYVVDRMLDKYGSTKLKSLTR